MPSVQAKPHEPVETTLRRFKRTCEKEGLMGELRKRQAYEKPTAKRKRLASAARKRHLKSQSRGKVSTTRSRGGFGSIISAVTSSANSEPTQK